MITNNQFSNLTSEVQDLRDCGYSVNFSYEKPVHDLVNAYLQDTDRDLFECLDPEDVSAILCASSDDVADRIDDAKAQVWRHLVCDAALSVASDLKPDMRAMHSDVMRDLVRDGVVAHRRTVKPSQVQQNLT